MKYLVTGGTGFIGSNLVSRLERDGYEVAITGTNGEQRLKGFKGIRLASHFSELEFNFLSNVDVIFHQAAINDTTSEDRESMFRVNVSDSMRLFQNAIRSGVKHIVYASSTAVYGDAPAPYIEDKTTPNPLNVYAESKLALDEKAMQLAEGNPDVTIVGLRYCNVYGKGESHKGKRASMIYQLAQQILERNPKIFKYGDQKRDWIYVDDVVAANLSAAQSRESCIVNCGSGQAVTFNRLIEILNSAFGTEKKTEYFDMPPSLNGKYQNHTECDMTLAKEKIGFVPRYSVEAGIRDFHKAAFTS